MFSVNIFEKCVFSEKLLLYHQMHCQASVNAEANRLFERLLCLVPILRAEDSVERRCLGSH